ncbi:MAG TPA: beta-ketoacyl-ACP synthase III [Ktedonobacterales bacterium]|nr:beta-ketoacyl-ACP synthase III [Ktedonobacterales bacterium]
MSQSSAITGWGMYVPEKVLTNEDLEHIVDTSDEWITSRTGIKQRHVAAPDESASTLALAAARQALERAGIEGKDLGLVLVATVCGDYPFPSTACIVQNALGAQGGAFDLQAACSGFLYGVATAHQFIANGAVKHALIVGVEVLSRVVDYTDRATCVLFGDGAGAVVLSASDTPGGLLGFTLGSDGARPEQLWIPTGGSVEPTTEQVLRDRRNFVQMQGSEVFKFATRIMGTAMEEALGNAGMTASDMDLFIPHQANLRIIEAASKRLNLPSEKVFVNIQNYGNTSAAAIPIALCEAIDQGRVYPGAHLGMVAFGAGLTWAAAVVKWTAPLSTLERMRDNLAEVTSEPVEPAHVG